MFNKRFYNSLLPGLILFILLALASVAAANINDQVDQLDFDTAKLDDIIAIFGDPAAYHWQGRTYTKDNLPDIYIVQYRNNFSILMVNGYIEEFRWLKGRADWKANFTPPTSPY